MIEIIEELLALEVDTSLGMYSATDIDMIHRSCCFCSHKSSPVLDVYPSIAGYVCAPGFYVYGWVVSMPNPITVGCAGAADQNAGCAFEQRDCHGGRAGSASVVLFHYGRFLCLY